MFVWRELNRRNVVKVAVTYAIVGWLVLQVADTLFPALQLPAWTVTFVAALLVLGFPIALLLSWAYEITPQGIKRTKDVPTAESVTHVTGQRLNYIIIALLLAAVTALAINNYLLPDDSIRLTSEVSGRSQSGDAAEIRPSDEDASITVAVLPFESFSNESEQEAFADGLTEEVLNSLAQLGRLRVTARTSSFAFKGSNQTIREIADALGVDHIVEGSVRRSGDTIRITAQLILAQDESQLWSEAFDRDLQEIFEIQEEIARAVAEALEITLGVGDLGRRPGMTRSLEAYEQFLLGVQRLPDISTNDAERNLRASVAYFERAVDIDPEFALAWLAISNAYNEALPFVPNAPSDEWVETSSRAMDRAMELAPDSVEIRANAAHRALQRGEWIEGSRLSSRLINDSSSSAFDSLVARIYGQSRMLTGSPEEAIPFLERAKLFDPLDGPTAQSLGQAYLYAGNASAALSEFDRGLGLENGRRALLIGSSAVAALTTGDRALVEDRIQLLADSPDPTRDINLSMGALLDDPQSALSELRRVLEDADSSLIFAVVSNWAAFFGDAELALDALRRIPLPEETWVVAHQIWRPTMKDVRQLPGFRDLVAEMGLIEYWEELGWPELCQMTSESELQCR